MNAYKVMKLTDIHVSKRLRKVDDDHALVLMASIEQDGLINPITVRHTPRAKAPYTLVAGAHRYRAHELAPLDKIGTIIVKADALDGQLLEIAENLIGNDLSVLDRAKFVIAYREKWEDKHGKISPKGGRPQNRVNLTQLIHDELENGFSAHAADRLGLSVSSIKRSTRIAKNLPQDLCEVLHGTPVADNQSALLNFASLEPAKRKIAAQAFEKADGDLIKTFDYLDDRKVSKPSAQQKLLDRLVDSWGRADKNTKSKFQKFMAGDNK